MKNALQGIHWGRGLAALAVVLFHTEITLAKPKYFGADTWALFNYFYCGVHFFFVLSGYIMLRSHAADIGQPARARAFIWKRFKRIVPPLWAVLLPLACLMWWVPALAGGEPLSAALVAQAFFLTPTAADPLLAVEWTLRHEVLFYAAFVALIVNRGLGIAVFMAWVGLILATLAGAEWLNPVFSSPLNLLFLLGMGVCVWGDRLHAAQPRGPWLGALALMALLAGFACTVGLDVRVHDGLGALTLGIPSALLIHWAARSTARLPAVAERVLNTLGDASYAVYLVHFPIISVLCKLVMKAHLPQVPAFAAVALGSVAAGVAFHRWVERPLLAGLSRFGA